MYQTIYDLILPLFNGAVNTGYIDLVCTLVSTFLLLFVLSVPFIIVWHVLKLICRW